MQKKILLAVLFLVGLAVALPLVLPDNIQSEIKEAVFGGTSPEKLNSAAKPTPAPGKTVAHPLPQSAPVAASTVAQSAPVAASAAVQPASATLPARSLPVESLPAKAVPAAEPAPQATKKTVTTNMKAARPKKQRPADLRYCLDLPTNEAIAKCAYDF